ncbi:hypothetical protein [Actinoallomurus iriomotensis]|uniref:Pycsar effector protein domain-containing protein n=1 Tax=Actinoallomurus iriomotensis TaxID=478107 RepID=A0A9W6W2G2_9ACTN|nr:hypothetical protein [Actinoallomurus iriomotensis]GLY88419.1 hypothetical protein Airi02_063480 [Actinoallomurus iriomotensis]
MLERSESDTDLEKHLDSIHWFMERGDKQRASLAARAGTLVSANTLIVAGVAAFSTYHKPSVETIVGLLIVLLFILVSTFSAIRVLLNVREFARFNEEGLPSTLTYNSKFTLDRAKSYQEFRELFMTQTLEERVDSALVELWRNLRIQQFRYSWLRIAITWFTLAMGASIALVAILVISR